MITSFNARCIVTVSSLFNAATLEPVSNELVVIRIAKCKALLPHGRAEPAGVSQLSLNRCDKRRRLHLQLEDLSVTG
jgi:hypothetical protein